MPERKPSPEAELIDDVKDLALEAATQFLNGIALARRVSEEVTGSRVAPNVKGAERGAKPLADVLFGAARLSTNQLKAALSFQRWATETLVSSLTRSGAEEQGASALPLQLEARLGDSVTCAVGLPEGAEPIDAKETHVQVWAVRGGPRFYVDFRIGEISDGKAELELRIDEAKFDATAYAGRIVMRDPRGVETVKPLQLTVSA